MNKLETQIAKKNNTKKSVSSFNGRSKKICHIPSLWKIRNWKMSNKEKETYHTAGLGKKKIINWSVLVYISSSLSDKLSLQKNSLFAADFA